MKLWEIVKAMYDNDDWKAAEEEMDKLHQVGGHLHLLMIAPPEGKGLPLNLFEPICSHRRSSGCNPQWHN